MPFSEKEGSPLSTLNCLNCEQISVPFRKVTCMTFLGERIFFSRGYPVNIYLLAPIYRVNIQKLTFSTAWLNRYDMTGALVCPCHAPYFQAASDAHMLCREVGKFAIIFIRPPQPLADSNRTHFRSIACVHVPSLSDLCMLLAAQSITLFKLSNVHSCR